MTSTGVAPQASPTSTTRPLAVVTGASSGIGLELAKEFARHGCDLIVAADEASVQDAARELQAFGAQAEPVQVDLATFEGVEELYARIQADPRPVDAIAINAGVGNGGDFARDVPLEDELRLIGLNVNHPVHLAKRVIGDMVARGHGRVLFTSSIAATMPGPWYATYAASRAFVQSFAEGIRVELKDTGVTVTALQPGPTDTRFFERAGMQDTPVGSSDAIKDDAAKVAAQGYAALMAGRDSVVAGSPMNKAQALMSNVLPERLNARLHGGQAKPGTGRS